MRVCPKTCYLFSPIWRNTLRRLYTQHAHIDDVEAEDPELAKVLRDKKYVYRDGVKYRLNKSGTHVHRIAATLCQNPDPFNPSITEPNTEKSKARILGVKVKNQRRLLEESSLAQVSSTKKSDKDGC